MAKSRKRRTAKRSTGYSHPYESPIIKLAIIFIMVFAMILLAYAASMV